MKSPIKYYGGKSYKTKIILSHFPQDYDIYVEGFGGGASVLFEKEQKGIEIYNDLGENVYSLFKCLADKDKFVIFRKSPDLREKGKPYFVYTIFPKLSKHLSHI